MSLCVIEWVTNTVIDSDSPSTVQYLSFNIDYVLLFVIVLLLSMQAIDWWLSIAGWEGRSGGRQLLFSQTSEQTTSDMKYGKHLLSLRWSEKHVGGLEESLESGLLYWLAAPWWGCHLLPSRHLNYRTSLTSCCILVEKQTLALQFWALYLGVPVWSVLWRHLLELSESLLNVKNRTISAISCKDCYELNLQ